MFLKVNRIFKISGFSIFKFYIRFCKNIAKFCSILLKINLLYFSYKYIFLIGGMKMCSNYSQKYYKSMFKNYPDVVNVKELQSMLGGISKKLAYHLLQNNIIKSIKIGRQYKIAKADVILYLTEKNCS